MRLIKQLRVWNRRFAPGTMWIAAAAALALVAGGCSEDEETCPSQPFGEVGRIEGSVMGAGGPLVGIEVTAGPLPRSSSDVGAQVDSKGRYSLELLPGRYNLRVGSHSDGIYYRHDGTTFNDEEADTLTIAEGEVVSANFTFGGLRVQVEVPHELEGEPAFVYATWIETGSQRSEKAGIETVHVSEHQVEAEFNCLPPGQYSVQLSVGGQDIWLPGSYSQVGAVTREVVTGEFADMSAALPAMSWITGAVTGSWQAMRLESPEVMFYDADSVLVTRVETDALGAFAAPVLLPASVRVLVEIADCARWIGGDTFADAQVLDVQSGSIISGVDLVESGLLLEAPFEGLDDTRELAFEVVSAGDLAPIHVSVPRHGNWHQLIPVPNLLPGDYLLRFSSHEPFVSGWIPQWYDRVDSSDEATVITIGQTGGVVHVPLSFTRGGSMLGTVRWDEAYHFAVLHICVTNALSQEPLGIQYYYFGEDDLAQVLDLHGFADGDYKLGAWIDDESHATELPSDVTWFPGTADWDSAGVISVGDHGDVTGIDFTILSPPE